MSDISNSTSETLTVLWWGKPVQFSAFSQEITYETTAIGKVTVKPLIHITERIV